MYIIPLSSLLDWRAKLVLALLVSVVAALAAWALDAIKHLAVALVVQ